MKLFSLIRTLCVILFMALALVACSENKPVEDGIVISNATVRAPMTGRTISSGYFTITNHSQVDDALIEVESPIAEKVEMHLSESVDGVMKMRRQVSIDLKAGETVIFKPGSYHLMLFGMQMDKDAKDTALTLKFKHAPDVTIIADVTMLMDHSGHH